MGENSGELTVLTQDLRRTYVLGGVPLHALAGVDLEVKRGEYISIMGPSGSGKSTLFNMIGGLDKPTAGKVVVDYQDLATLGSAEMAWFRCHKVGYVFQTFNLLPVMTALENVTLPMIFAGLSTSEAHEKGMQILETVGLKDRAGHKPNELSGGQQQRVAIARALANDPAIILADEPTGNLDRDTGRAIIKLLKQMNEERGVTVITATHDDKMLDVSDRVVTVRDGKIQQIQNRDELRLVLGTIEGE